MDERLVARRLCSRCRGSGLDPALTRRYTSGGRDDQACSRCLGECFVGPEEDALAVAVVWPEPTAGELATLKFHISAWGNRTHLQQSICLAILRGHDQVPEIAKYLHMGKTEVKTAVAELVGQGLLWDNQRLLLH